MSERTEAWGNALCLILLVAFMFVCVYVVFATLSMVKA